MKEKKISYALLALAFLGLFASCGSGESDTANHETIDEEEIIPPPLPSEIIEEIEREANSEAEREIPLPVEKEEEKEGELPPEAEGTEEKESKSPTEVEKENEKPKEEI